MWFSHLKYVALASARLERPLDPLALAWGAICCDVDKITDVPRSVSHYGHEGLSFPPERFAAVAGLSPALARTGADFLAGYLSHLAVDEAWYGHFRGMQARDPALAEGWDAQTMRAINVLLDRRNQAAFAPLYGAGLDLDAAEGHALLPHLRGGAAETMRRVGALYLRWDGSLSWDPGDPLISKAIASFRALVGERADRTSPILAALEPEALDAAVVDFTEDALRRFLGAIEH